ncbi:hypothetical protein EY643_01360 [Halioglobus maricola]|uniref:Sulfotransferase family protein n=1 Tax=Halioglobus maricola TaxID=2601894 RepID=A0A5P9NFU9_9GAMM|nr:sulfotransferase family 2 domain-containing protein [Halioglobus maricola]QFU74406.1 hypothetical protein EY643_01360 [Halioglobus maricola]
MILSRQKNFIFIANIKTASTSIEAALRKYADIHVKTTRSGKHMSALELERQFINHWPRKYLGDAESYIRFGVIREPVSWFLSIYNSHTKSAFRGTAQYTGDSTIEEFLNRRVTRKQWQLRDQHLRFCNGKGKPMVDFLIRYEFLQSDFKRVCEHLDLDANMPHANKSPQKISVENLSPNTRRQIEEAYSSDLMFYEEYAGRPISRQPKDA